MIVMITTTYTALRRGLASALDRVNEDHAPMLVTRQNGKEAVLMSLDDYQSIQETLYLMHSSNNADRLQGAITQLRNGEGKSRDLIE